MKHLLVLWGRLHFEVCLTKFIKKKTCQLLTGQDGNGQMDFEDPSNLIHL